MTDTGYGHQRGLSAQGGLFVVGILIAITCWMLATGYDSAAARVREQGTYCLRIGPHPSGLAMWSDDGVHWYE